MSSRALLALVLVTPLEGCPQGGNGDACEVNAECAPDVCGRDHVCTDASNVREVTVTWTLNPQTFWRRVLMGRMRQRQLTKTEVPTSLAALGAAVEGAGTRA
jgi:hypothetical protein